MTVQVKSANTTGLVYALWTLSGMFGLVLCSLFVTCSSLFGYEYRVVGMPIPELVAGLALAGLFPLLLFWLIRYSTRQKANRYIIPFIIIVFGLGMRLLMFGSEPVLEDDYQRYLWDGALTANGINPYRYSPDDVIKKRAGDQIPENIIREAGPVLARINHPELRTIYPPVSQIMFAMAYYLKPFSISAWRFVILACELTTIFLLAMILLKLGKSPVWLSLYWWNPLVIKELMNSGHMEAVLLPFLFGAILLAFYRRTVPAGIFLVLAAGVKIWPLALFPIILRPLTDRPLKLLFSIVPAAILLILLAIPVLLTSLDSGSGFVAYATRWKTNSALFPLLTAIGNVLNVPFGLTASGINAGVRGFIVLVMLTILIRLCIPAIRNNHDLLGRIALAVLAVFLLSPAQFPWYYVWVAPFAVFFPISASFAVPVTISFYYLAFYFMSRGDQQFYGNVVIWVVWIPVWTLLLFDLLKSRRGMLPFADKIHMIFFYEKRHAHQRHYSGAE